MKKILNRNLASVLVVNIFLLMLAPPTWAQGATEQVVGRHRAIVAKVSGDVDVKTAGSSEWVKAVVNRELKTGDKIRTGAGANCKIKVSGQGADLGDFDIGASSEVTVGNLQQVKTTARAFFMLQKAITRDDVGMDLKSGDMRSGFHRAEGRVGNYNVYTPVAVAGVRGTKFELDLDGGKPWYEKLQDEGKGQGEEMDLTATVLEGEVALSGPNWQRTLDAGQQLHATTGQIPGNATNADSSRLDNIDKSLKVSTDQTAPTFAGAVSVAKTGANAVVSWQPASDDSSTPDRIVYDIFASTSSAAQDFSSPTATSSAGATQFTLTNLQENSNYYVVVRARDEAGNHDANTKEVSSATGDNKAPTFNGAASISRTSGTTATVTWEAATDNVTAPSAIVYDLYVATSSQGENYTTALATTDAGATSFNLENLNALSTYYVVVRARDAAGNRDPNTAEVSTSVAATATAADNFDTNVEIERMTKELFTDYEREDQSNFMSLVNPSFAGVNNTGNALSYTTLEQSVKSDFDILSSSSFEPSITSLTSFGGNRIGARVNWSARFHFTSVDTEVVLSGLNADLIWSTLERPFSLVSWGGSSPFGLTVPSDTSSAGTTQILTTITELTNLTGGGGTQNVPAPSIASVSGFPSSLDLSGDYHDFAPFRATVSGTNFQSGARVEWYDASTTMWTDLGTMSTSEAASSVFFSAADAIFVDFSKLIVQYFNGDLSTEDFKIRVVNPDGQVSNEYTFSVSSRPGPINLTSLSTDKTVLNSPGSGPYNFTVTGFNIVTSVSGAVSVSTVPNVVITQADGVTQEPNFTVSNVALAAPSALTSPQTLTFQSNLTGSVNSGTYDVKVTDARSQSYVFFFNVSPSTNVTWSTNQTLTSDYIIPAGNTLNVSNGVTVTSSSGAKIIVQGSLNAGSANFNGVGIDVQSGGTAILNGATVQNVSGAPGVNVSGGSANITNGSLTSNQHGALIASGSLTMSGTTITGSTFDGIEVNGGTASLTNLSVTSNGAGLKNNGSGNVTISGGSYSSNTAEGIVQNGSGTLSIQGGATISGNNPDNVRVSSSGSLVMTNASITGANAGLRVDATASGAAVQLSGVTISAPSTFGIVAATGTIQLNGSNTINGGSTSSIDLSGNASLQTAGSSNIITGSGTSAGVATGPGSSGSVSISSGTTISNTTNGLFIRGSGSVTLNGSIQNCSAAGADINSFASVVTISGASVTGGVRGILVDNSGGISASSTTIQGSMFGVERVATGTGAIFLSGCNLTGSGGHDLTVLDPSAGQNNPNGANGGYKNFFNSGDRVLNPQ